MGRYVNPIDGTSKEDWLKANGEAFNDLEAIKSFKHSASTKLPVCLVDNGAFTAAAIAYDAREIAEFTRDSDHRPKQWYMVNKELLKPFM